MKLTGESKLFAGLFVGTALIVGIAAILLSQPPKPIPREELVVSATRTHGPRDAKTWLVEFSDFQCPSCRRFADAVDQLAVKHPDTLLIAYRHYPLPYHAQARTAALAAEAAGDQGKFWEMGTALFRDQDTWSGSDASASAFITAKAQSLGLEPASFSASLKDPRHVAHIDEDIAMGDRIRLKGTPTFYLNGLPLTLSTPENLIRDVEAAIGKN